MIRYNVRSRQLVDVIGDLRRGKIILSPYFQRNLVWRTLHKVDFIKTVLMGFPFPQIFIAKGELDIEDMSTTSVIVDGQQRMNSIIEYLDNSLEVDGKYFKNLPPDKKTEFLKYEIAIIELDLEADDPQVIEVFQRLNRTFYSLSAIEKLATEYAPSELMLVANLLCKELSLKLPKDITIDPKIPREFIEWAKKQDVSDFNKAILESPVFTNYEIARKVHLMMVLNIIATGLVGFFNRNISKKLLDTYANDNLFKDVVVKDLNFSARFFNSMNLSKDSYWNNKSNFFSLILIFALNREFFESKSPTAIKKKLNEFYKNLPGDYELAAKEGVNNKKERILRDKSLKEILQVTSDMP